MLNLFHKALQFVTPPETTKSHDLLTSHMTSYHMSSTQCYFMTSDAIVIGIWESKYGTTLSCSPLTPSDILNDFSTNKNSEADDFENIVAHHYEHFHFLPISFEM